MFEFYKRGNPDRNIELTRKLNPGLQRFDVWVQENKEKLVQSFKSIEIQSSWVFTNCREAFFGPRYETLALRMFQLFKRFVYLLQTDLGHLMISTQSKSL